MGRAARPRLARCCAGRTACCSAARRSRARSTGCCPAAASRRGETLEEALHRELGEELGLWDDAQFEGPIAVAESIAPDWTPGDATSSTSSSAPTSRTARSRTSRARTPPCRGARLFSLDELEEIVVHPPMKRFVQRWQPGRPGGVPRLALGAVMALGRKHAPPRGRPAIFASACGWRQRRGRCRASRSARRRSVAPPAFRRNWRRPRASERHAARQPARSAPREGPLSAFVPVRVR